VLWQFARSSGIHASPILADFDQDGRPEVLAAWSYSDIVILDGKSGRPRWSARLEQDDGGIEGLFGTPTPLPGAPGVLIAPTAWWGQQDGVIGVGVDDRVFRTFEGRVSASAVVADLDGDRVLEAVIGTESGRLIALHADGGHAELAHLGGPIEASALFGDVDADGALELLVASNDGALNCFGTSAKDKAVVPRFRGESPHNRGDLGALRLGWQSRAAAARTQPPAAASSPGNIRIDYLRCCNALQEQATRAPAPGNAALLQTAAACNAFAGSGIDRARAMSMLAQILQRAALPVPTECR